MVRGKRISWASKDNRFWMGLYLGLSFSAGMLLVTIGSKVFGR